MNKSTGKVDSKFYEKMRFANAVGYNPHKVQEKFHLACDNYRFISLAGGARSGKSMAGGFEIAYASLMPDYRIWCCSAVYELAEKEFIWAIEFLSRFLLPDGRKLIDFYRVSASARGSQHAISQWGSFFRTKSTEKSQTLLGEELNLLVLGEASQVPQEPYNRMLRARLGSRGGKCLALSTPNSDAGLFQDFFQKGQDEDESEYWSIQCSTIDNPTFSHIEFESARQELDEKVFAEQYEGKFVSRRGRCFPMLRDDIHIIKEIPAGVEGMILRSVYNHNNSYNSPLICLWMLVVAKTGTIYVFDEIFANQSLVEDKAGDIKDKDKGRRIVGTMTDYWNPNIQEALKKNGIKPSTNDEKQWSRNMAITRRLQAVQNALKVHDSKSRLYVLANCENCISELKGLKWKAEPKEMLEKAAPAMPSDKFISSAMAISFVVAKIKLALGHDIYKTQGRYENAN